MEGEKYTAPEGNITVSYTGADPTAGVFVEYYKETIQFVGYSLTEHANEFGVHLATT